MSMLVHIDARHAHVLHPSEVRRHLLVASALRHLHLRPCLLSHLLILRLKLLATPATAMFYSKRKTMLAHCMFGLRRLMRAWHHRTGPAHHVGHPAPSPPPALQASAPPPADASVIQVSPSWTHVRMSATDGTASTHTQAHLLLTHSTVAPADSGPSYRSGGNGTGSPVCASCSNHTPQRRTATKGTLRTPNEAATSLCASTSTLGQRGKRINAVVQQASMRANIWVASTRRCAPAEDKRLASVCPLPLERGSHAVELRRV